MSDEHILQYIDGIPYKLKNHFDFSFLQKYGRVFKVFDGQESGNICFGIENGGKRYFIKFAGAPAAKYFSDIPGAISRLNDAVQVYKDLTHPNLIEFLEAEEIGGGLAMIFNWTDAESMHSDYGIKNDKFNQVTIETLLRIYEDILDFHNYVAEKNYVATDFYEANIMWDFSKKKTFICDIDFYSKTPWGGMAFWENSPLAAPEERFDGGVRDKLTNVYNMGAIAFTLFSGGDRLLKTWPLNSKMYEVVKKAVSEDRDNRQQSIKQLIIEWNRAKAVE